MSRRKQHDRCDPIEEAIRHAQIIGALNASPGIGPTDQQRFTFWRDYAISPPVSPWTQASRNSNAASGRAQRKRRRSAWRGDMREDHQQTPQCHFCGGPEHVAIFEVWGHDFMIETCCEPFYEQIVRDINDGPEWARELMRRLDVEELCGRLRRVADDGACGLVLDWQLRLHPIGFHEVASFIRRHHAHCNPPVTWRFHQAISNGPTLIGVAVVGNPVARAFAGRRIVEVSRLCIRRDTPAALRWNAASMLYGWCAREAARRGWSKIITYTRSDEPGTSLQAAGFVRECTVRGRGWHSARRSRSNRNSWIDKVRWSRTLEPKRQTQRQRSRENGLALFRANQR